MVEPQLWVTVLGYSGNLGDKVGTPTSQDGFRDLCSLSQSVQVFMQGVHVDNNNCSQLVNSLRRDLNKHENLLANGNGTALLYIIVVV